ncbi:PP2C family protein-serine/threonine phosphatase [Humitalea sp. 24SJ18S-53]|uniref:PP2C family protein-serine/threonine phosphatase n=1 Tax=Humitalea sp. 24SJ18S-53 TaxID=3422307 RepID=UPI003D67E45A
MSGVLGSTACSHPGAVRKRNEDNLVDRPEVGLWAVADGAGGHGAGDVASTAIAEALIGIPPGLSAAEMLAQVRLRLDAVHADMQSRAEERGTGGVIASTVVVLLARGGHYAALWAGDSRIYVLRGGVLHRVTRDHSLVQELVDSGALTEEEAERHPQANIITRAIGAQGALALDKVSDRIQPGDRFMLCSDGVFKELPEAQLAGMMLAGAGADQLVSAAVAAGARDNVTVVVVNA